jgi:serine/threonine protein kinase/uncharacterized protein involved in tolerance to divalent cations
MKKLFPLLLILMIIVFGVLILKNHITSHVILLKDGSRIVADESWVVGDKVFYEKQGQTDFIPIDQVSDLKQGGFKQGSGIATFIKDQWESGRESAGDLFNRPSPGTWSGKSPVLRWMPLLIGMLLCIFISVLLLRKRRSHMTGKKKETPAPPVKNVLDADPANRGQEIIAEHFLKVFKAQKAAEVDAEAVIKKVESHPLDNNHIYELRVKMGDEWTSRRMTLGPIGEDSGSRSRCYYVIYDDHLVVKVPPFPVKSFTTYRQRLRKEAEIASKLAPRECLVPQISTILKKVHPFREAATLPAEQLETKYADWIEENPDFQQYLQIEGAYAYFMDLSKYFFLKHIVDNMHDPLRNIPKEITGHPEIIWNSLEFEARYGQAGGLVCDELQAVYTSFENRVREYLGQHQPDIAFHKFQIKEWFLLFLSNGRLSASDMGMKTGTASGLNGIANKLFKEKRKPVETYRKMVTTYVTNKGLTRNKAQISGMITNLLDLLAWLHQSNVAMRDLKPDNLLVAGDPSKFPQFLESASLYSIGLIDVETAVWLGKDQGNPIDQPLLGGTPSYATPTHTLPNKRIQEIYGDLPLILHLQDWYATIAMVFNMVTGKRLFKDTAKNLIRIKKDIKKGVEEKGRGNEVLGKASRMFWSEALSEFEHKTGKQENKLKYISMIMSPDSRDVLLPVILETHQYVENSIKELMLNQTSFKSDKLKKSLYASTYMKVNRFRSKFSTDAATSKMPVEAKKTALKVLDELATLKRQADQLSRAGKQMNKSNTILSSYDLLHSMFTIVLVHMHQKIWGVVGSDR